MKTKTIASLPDHLLADETVEFRKITAIIRALTLEAVEKNLIATGVRGVTITRVKGYGEYADFFSRDWMTEHVRIEIFTHRDRVAEIRDAIFAATGTPSPPKLFHRVSPSEARSAFPLEVRSERQLRGDVASAGHRELDRDARRAVADYWFHGVTPSRQVTG